ncbi:hypothetical protein [Nodosilinea sp. P-1105]|uniref:hypothetical protein n=1 Tax=Nodosilinea sp. P-1105 TaxID=2546229 RepID=UPI00146E5290|nr:hypothetical protein [Nodosilinea sp. P-1105]NMF84342.1 hypothetical protein [Nodosilinea sp. P-1105]
MLQDSSLDFKLVQRVCLLQHALDQAMETLEEMQQQVANHQMLQAHLAQTEEYANVQQKIIINLQRQLQGKDQWQQQMVSQLLVEVRALVTDQQLELERLRVRIYQSQAEVQDYLVRLKNHYQTLSISFTPDQEQDLNSEVMIVRALTVSLSSQLQAAQQHIQQLDSTLTKYQVTFARLHAQVNQGPPLETSFHSPTPDGHQPEPALTAIADDPIALRAIVEAQKQKIDELTDELSYQFRQQTSLKYRCQEIAAERDRLRQQAIVLKLENEALQEQVIPQNWLMDSTS